MVVSWKSATDSGGPRPLCDDRPVDHTSARDGAVPRRGTGHARGRSPTSCSIPGSTSSPCGSTTPSSWRPGSRPRAPTCSWWSPTSVSGPVFDLPLARDRLVPGRPDQRRRARRHRRRHPGAARARVATPTRSPRWRSALLFAVTRWIVPADRDVRAGRPLPRRHDPLPALPRLAEARGRPRASWGCGAVGRAVKWRFEGLGMRVDRARPVRRRRDALARRAPRRSRRRHDARDGHARDHRDDRCRAVRHACAKGSVYLNTARAALHDTDALVDALRDGPLGGAGLDHFVGERLRPTTALLARQRRAHPAHRRRDLRHRGQPLAR